MMDGARGAPNRTEQLMILGAWLAPFNFFLGVQIGGLYLRPLHLWAIVAAGVLAVVDGRKLIAAVDGPVLSFWTMFAFIALSTLLATPAQYKFRGLADVGLLLLNVLAFSVVRCHYEGREREWTRFLLHLGVSSVVMSSALIVRAFAAGASGQAVGVDSFALGLGTVAGTYTATFAAAAAVAIVFAETRRQLTAATIAYVVHANAALFCLARGPWLAFLIAVLVSVPLAAWTFGRPRRTQTIALRLVLILAAIPVFAEITVFNPFMRGLVVQRVVQVVNLEAGTGSSRLIMWQEFLHDAGRSPIFGHGAAAYREISEGLGVQGSVSENFVVEILHAGGAVAVTFLLLGLGWVALRCLFEPGGGRRPAIIAGCFAALVAMVISSMTNPAGWNGLFWLLGGLVAARPVMAARENRDGLAVNLGGQAAELVPTG